MTGLQSFTEGLCVCVLREASVSVEVGLPSRALPTHSSPLFCPPQVWSFLTSTPKGATSSTSTKPSRPVRSRTRWWPPSSSCSGPGRRAWTGATQAGCRTPRCSTPSRRPGTPVEAWAWPPVCAATARATATCTATTSSASLLPSGVSQLAMHGPVGGRAASEGAFSPLGPPCWCFQLKPCPTECLDAV